MCTPELVVSTECSDSAHEELCNCDSPDVVKQCCFGGETGDTEGVMQDSVEEDMVNVSHGLRTQKLSEAEADSFITRCQRACWCAPFRIPTKPQSPTQAKAESRKDRNKQNLELYTIIGVAQWHHPVPTTPPMFSSLLVQQPLSTNETSSVLSKSN